MKKVVAIVVITCFLAFGFAAIASAATHTIYITNQTGFTWYKLYVKASDNSYWGTDLLGRSVCLDGDTAYVTLLYYSSSWDIKVIDEYGNVYYKWRQPLSSYGGITLYR